LDFRTLRLNDVSVLLLYTPIDILASLARPEKSDATDSSFFKAWVGKYLEPGRSASTKGNMEC